MISPKKHEFTSDFAMCLQGKPMNFSISIGTTNYVNMYFSVFFFSGLIFCLFLLWRFGFCCCGDFFSRKARMLFSTDERTKSLSESTSKLALSDL